MVDMRPASAAHATLAGMPCAAGALWAPQQPACLWCRATVRQRNSLGAERPLVSLRCQAAASTSGRCSPQSYPSQLILVWRAVFQAKENVIEAVSVCAGTQRQTVLSVRQWALLRSTMKPACSATKRHL